MTITFFGITGGIQSRESTNTSFAVRAGQISLLVDCSGSPVMSLRQDGIDPRSLDAVVLTHAHTDHIYAFPSLVHNLWLMGREPVLRVIGNPGTLARARQLCEPLGLLQKKGLFPIEWLELEDGQVSPWPGCTTALFPVEHSVPTSGVRITAGGATVVYSSDTSPCRRVVNEARGAQVLVHEASGTEVREADLNAKGHSSGRQAGSLAREVGVQTLFLCHVDPTDTESVDSISREAAAAHNGEVIVPKPGVAYEIGSGAPASSG